MDTVFERYKNITGTDIELFFNDFIDFTTDKYQNIVSYYSNGAELKSDTLDDLDDLTKKVELINNQFHNYKDQLNTYFDMWEILAQFEEIRGKIQTINNSQKWFRSNKGLSFDNDVEVDYILRQGQTLTNLAKEVGYSDPKNDWVNIALKNDLDEEDYDADGGVLLKITFKNGLNVKLNSVLDSISGLKVYGKDLDRTITLDTDEEDLKVLEYKDTIYQAFKILLETVQGSVPEFPEDGISGDLIGSNVNAFQYPVIFRQLGNLIAKDDTFENFSIISVDRDEDMTSLSLSVGTRINEVLNQQLILQ